MKKRLILATCLAVALPVQALLRGRGYRSVQDFLNAENLLIVRADRRHAVKVLYNRDQVRTYAVVCLKVLNGRLAKRGDVLAVDCEHPLVDGRRYLLAGEKATLGGRPWPLFMNHNSAVKLADGLRMSSLEGKDKRSQVSTIVRARIREIDALRKKLERERQGLETLVPPASTAPVRPGPPDRPDRRARAR